MGNDLDTRLADAHLRPADLVMQPEMLGAARPTRYAFSRTLLRRAQANGTSHICGNVVTAAVTNQRGVGCGFDQIERDSSHGLQSGRSNQSALTMPCSMRLSAIWIVLSAAPLRRLSPDRNRLSPCSAVSSTRMRPT